MYHLFLKSVTLHFVLTFLTILSENRDYFLEQHLTTDLCNEIGLYVFFPTQTEFLNNIQKCFGFNVTVETAVYICERILNVVRPLPYPLHVTAASYWFIKTSLFSCISLCRPLSSLFLSVL